MVLQYEKEGDKIVENILLQMLVIVTAISSSFRITRRAKSGKVILMQNLWHDNKVAKSL